MLGKIDSSVLDEDRLYRDAARFRASPDFETVLRDYTFALIDFRRDPRVVNKLISRETRFLVIAFLLFLHAEKVLSGGEGGVTYGEMLDICARHSGVSLRVLKAILPMLVLTGFAGVARDPADRRIKIYTPSAKLFAVARARIVPMVAALQTLEPGIPRTAALRHDPLFVLRAAFRGGFAIVTGVDLADCMPEFGTFTGDREGAAQVVYAVMLADMEAKPLPSRSAIAKQFGLSKTQVWSVFAEGERQGYFAGNGDAVPAATDKLRAQYRDWMALELALCASVLAPE
jgi:hypothetical protein